MLLPCRRKIRGNFCPQTNRVVTDGFCNLVCKGDFAKFKIDHPDVRMERMKKPVNINNGLVSVIIPYGRYDKIYLKRTIESVQNSAAGDIEILTEYDSKDEGHRVLTNRLAKRANGEYLLRLDAHCALSPEWDIRMKDSCKENTVVVPILSGLDVSSWKWKDVHAGLVVLDKQMRNVYPMMWKDIEERDTEEDTLSLIGCAYMVRKEDFDPLNESYGKWGAAGLELSFRTWLTGGRVLVRTDVICGHLFRPEGKTPFGVDLNVLNNTYLRIGRLWRDQRGKGQTRPLSWLIGKFAKYLDGPYRRAI